MATSAASGGTIVNANAITNAAHMAHDISMRARRPPPPENTSIQARKSTAELVPVMMLLMPSMSMPVVVVRSENMVSTLPAHMMSAAPTTT